MYSAIKKTLKYVKMIIRNGSCQVAGYRLQVATCHLQPATVISIHLTLKYFYGVRVTPEKSIV